jgi:hypothetical protein
MPGYGSSVRRSRGRSAGNSLKFHSSVSPAGRPAARRRCSARASEGLSHTAPPAEVLLPVGVPELVENDQSQPIEIPTKAIRGEYRPHGTRCANVRERSQTFAAAAGARWTNVCKRLRTMRDEGAGIVRRRGCAAISLGAGQAVPAVSSFVREDDRPADLPRPAQPAFAGWDAAVFSPSEVRMMPGRLLAESRARWRSGPPSLGPPGAAPAL